MSRRVSPAWLIGLLLVLTGLGLAASLVPLRKCGSCHGLAAYWMSFVSPSIPPNAFRRVDCPDCADSGKVSLLRAWRPRVSDEVGQVLRGLQDPSGAQFRTALRPLLLSAGMKSDAFLELNDRRGTFGFPRFLGSEGTVYLVIPAHYTAQAMPDDSGAGILLVHPDGRALDCVQMSCSNRDADLSARILDKMGTDGAQIVLIPSPGGFGKLVEPMVSYRLYQWHRITRGGDAPGAGAPERDGVCRLRIAGDGLEILSPK